MTGPTVEELLAPDAPAGGVDSAAAVAALDSAAEPPAESAELSPARKEPRKKRPSDFKKRKRRRGPKSRAELKGELRDAEARAETVERELEAIRAARAAETAAAVSDPALEELTRELAEAIAFGASAACDVAAKAWGSHWELEQEEARAFGEAWAKPAAPYVGRSDLAVKLVPWLSALGVSYKILMPRVLTTQELAKRQPIPEARTPAGELGVFLE